MQLASLSKLAPTLVALAALALSPLALAGAYVADTGLDDCFTECDCGGVFHSCDQTVDCRAVCEDSPSRASDTDCYTLCPDDYSEMCGPHECGEEDTSCCAEDTSIKALPCSG